MDYYSILGVERDASRHELRRAYDAAARRLHPRGALPAVPSIIEIDCTSASAFHLVTEAFEVLSDPARRAVYDLLGAFADMSDDLSFGAVAGTCTEPSFPGADPSGSPAGYAHAQLPARAGSDDSSCTSMHARPGRSACPSAWTTAARPLGHARQQLCDAPPAALHGAPSIGRSGCAPAKNDLSLSFCCTASRKRRAPEAPPPCPVRSAGNVGSCSSSGSPTYHRSNGDGSSSTNVELRLGLTLEEMYTGCVKHLRLMRRVLREAPGGPAGVVVGANIEEVFRIDVQPGWREGTRVTFPGKGDEVAGQATGDLVLVVAQEAHRAFLRRGNDLHVRVKVPLATVVTGGRVSLPHLDGRVVTQELGPRALLPASCCLLLKGEGMPVLRKQAPAAGTGADMGSEAATRLHGDLHIHIEVQLPAQLPADQKQALQRLLVGAR